MKVGAQYSWSQTGITIVAFGAASGGRNELFDFAKMYCPIRYAIDIRNW
jgi:hypothetical protein